MMRRAIASALLVSILLALPQWAHAEVPWYMPESGSWSWMNYRNFTFDRDPSAPTVRSGGSNTVGDAHLNSGSITISPGSGPDTASRVRIDARFFLDGESIFDLEPAGVIDFTTSVTAAAAPNHLAEDEVAATATSRAEASFVLRGFVRFRLTITIDTAFETGGGGVGDLSSFVSFRPSFSAADDITVSITDHEPVEQTLVFEGVAGRKTFPTVIRLTVQSDSFAEIRADDQFADVSAFTRARLELFEIPSPPAGALLLGALPLGRRRRRAR